jgi:hypothetical protein
MNRIYWPGDEPIFYWPPDIPKSLSIDSFKALFVSQGYQECHDGTYHEGFDKVAIYFHPMKGVTHAAIFKANEGVWKSKLGPQWDISHELDGLNSDCYGYPAAFLERLAK